MSLINDSDMKNLLKSLEGWKYNEGSIKKTFSFDTYMDSIKFINLLAEEAEKANHHPDLSVGWCEIDVEFTSHEQGGVAMSCLDMAKKADSVF